MIPVLVYNDDGTQPMSHVAPGRVEEDLKTWVDQILDTPVEAYVGCTAHPEICYHDTKVGERFGERPGLRLNADEWLRREALDELKSRGTDPLRIYAERAHRRGKLFLAGIRMSDAHHRWPGKAEPEQCPHFPRFTLDHPEFRIVRPDGTQDVALDYSFAEVRALRLAIMEEIMRDYPVDGLELDFMRFCSHFPRPATVAQIAIMNDFIRAIRQMMDREWLRQNRPGRPLLGVRVPPTLPECAPNGLDPQTWIQEKLIDYLNPANFLWADFNIRLEEYLKFTRNSACKLLFSIQPWTAAPWNPETLPYQKAFTMTIPEFKALAANGYAAGADGMHCFNLCCELPGRRPEILETLNIIACRKTVNFGPRHYQYFPSDAGITETGGNCRQTLRLNTIGQAETFRFQMADGLQFDRNSCRLAWRIYHATTADRWVFRLNGQELAAKQIKVESHYHGYPVRPGAELPPHRYFELQIDQCTIMKFQNELEITPLNLLDDVVDERYMEVLEVWTS